MKKIFISLFLVFSFANYVQAGQIDFKPQITQTDYKPKEKIQVSWSSLDIPKATKLEIYIESVENGFLYPLKTKLKHSGKFKWKIPKNTAPATDYRLFMSTADKGPSVTSAISPIFTINNESKKVEQIKDFDIQTNIEKRKIDVYVNQSNGQYMNLNIACDKTKVKLISNGEVVQCNSWRYFSHKKDQLNLTYQKLTAEETKVYFTLDLQDKSFKLIQRLFADPVSLP